MYLPKAGDVFCFPLTPSEWLSGRVLLDAERQCFAPHRLPAGSPLTMFKRFYDPDPRVPFDVCLHPTCGTMIPKLALRCATCRVMQP